MSAHRSHPPTLLRLAERCIRDHVLVGRGDVVLAACSGGPDSTALLHALAHLAPRLGASVVAHGVDHGLRPGAAAELDQAGAVAARLGVPFAITRVEVGPGANLQARARAARLAALVAAAERSDAAVIATGHTADDRAETVLLRLLRGAGPRGLAALPPRAPAPGSTRVTLVRPLVLARRADVLAHLARHDLPFAEDPSNADPRFARARVRHELVPQLEAMAPRVVEHLCDLADMLGSGASGDPALAGLGRAQRKTVERARKLGQRGVVLRVAGGKDVEITFPAPDRILIQER